MGGEEDDRFLRIDEVVVDRQSNAVFRDGAAFKVEPKVMAVLLHLAAERGRVVGKPELVATVWKGAHVVDEAVLRAVSLARAALGDDAKRPRIIETVPSRGYRMRVSPGTVDAAPRAGPRTAPISRGVLAGCVAGAALAGALGAVLLQNAFADRAAAPVALLAPEPPGETPSPTPAVAPRAR